MASGSTIHPFLVLISFIIFSLSSLTNTQPIGFSVDLIHSDSPNSPLFNPSITPSDRLINAFSRSISRASYLKRVPIVSKDAQIEISPDSVGVYIMKISIGTPPHDTFAVFDTGSDLTWIQCSPCMNCFKQDQPIFDHTSSKTYQELPCESQPCKSLGTYDTVLVSCDEETDSTCHYQASYGNKTYISAGDVVFDTFTFGSASDPPQQIPGIVFGCGHNNSGPYPEVMGGVVGLGGGNLSIINQLDQFIHGKFSYCLSKPDKATSTVNFGSSAILSGPGVVSTPLITKDPETLYHVFLEGISVKTSTSGHSMIQYRAENDDPPVGNMIIDSAIPITRLPRDFYNRVESLLKDAIEGEPARDPRMPQALCYRVEDKVVLPNMVLHFGGGGVLELLPQNSFVVINEELLCWAVAAVDDDIVVLGSLAQIDFLVGFDLFKRQVSFKPTDCAKQ